MSENQKRKSPVKSFRINQYNNKHLEAFCKETKNSAAELINTLLEDYFITYESQKIQEELAGDLVHYSEW